LAFTGHVRTWAELDWDVKRLVASMAVAGRDNGLGTKKRRRVALAAAAA